MNEHQFMEEFCELLELESGSVTLSTELDDVVEYDSMAVLSLMEFFDSQGVDILPTEFPAFVTVRDIFNRFNI